MNAQGPWNPGPPESQRPRPQLLVGCVRCGRLHEPHSALAMNPTCPSCALGRPRGQ